MPADHPRSLADAIRAMDERTLVALLAARPDLAQPRPASLAELVERAGSQTSSRLAVERLNTWLRAVAEALAASPAPIGTRALAAWMEADVSAVEAGLDALRHQALVWGSSSSVQLTLAAASALGPHPGGLAAPSTMPLSEEQVVAALDEADDAERRLVDKLVWTPVGRLRGATRPLTLASATTAAERLVARRVLRPVDDETVVLAREVSLHLRGGRLFAEPRPQQPPPWPAATPTRLQNTAALGSASEAVEAATSLIEDLIAAPPRVLSSGGLGRRDQRALAAGGTESSTALLLAIAGQLGLVGAHGPQWLATPAFDRWAGQDGWTQWRELVRGWTSLDRWPDPHHDPLLPGGVRFVTILRRALLAELRHAAPGTPLDATRLAERVQWRHPGWPEQQVAEASQRFLAEACVLGVVALGASTDLVAASVDPGFPTPIHQFVVQSDLTALTAGPLHLDVRRRLALLTEKDGHSRRFTAASLRRALNAGLTSDRILDWLEHHSITPIPQPLTYLLSDVARQHGQIQVMRASTVITIEDAAVLEALLRSPRAQALGLRKVGPQAIAAQADANETVDLLRDLGHAPVATSGEGELLTAPRPARATRASTPASEPAPPTRDQLAELARALREPEGQTTPAPDLVALLGQAQANGDWVEVVHVDAQGRRRAQMVRVLGVGAGQARLVSRASAPVTVPLSRVVNVTPL